MPRAEHAQRLMPSIIDRLIDPESGGTAAAEGYSIEQMIEAVRRDLEELLNTRRTDAGIPDIFTEVHTSIVSYGLPDLVTMDAVSEAEREEIGRTIEATIARFEPRLRDVKVTLIELGGEAGRTLQFHIDAQLDVDPSPEVGFETVLELTTGHAAIKRKEA
jgi:type VI secretion system protein ImpF